MKRLLTTALLTGVLIFGTLLNLPSHGGLKFFVAAAGDEIKSESETPALTQHRIAGRVVDKISGVAYSGYTIKAFPADAPQTLLGEARTDNQGRYEISFTSRRMQPRASLREIPKLSLQVYNRTGQRVKSVMQLPFNSRNLIQVDFFLYRKEAIPNDFCCSSSNNMGKCPTRLQLTNKVLNRLIGQLKLSGLGYWKLRQKAFETLMRSLGPADDCGERRKIQLIKLLRSRGEAKLVSQLTETCLSGLPLKTFNSGRFEIEYVEDQNYEPFAVDPARPTITKELKLPGEISLGYLRADLDVPSYVQQIALIAEYSLTRFLGHPLYLKDPRGNHPTAPIPISICFLEESAGATTPSQTYIEINSKNSLIQNFGTVPHELFHRVQYQYNNTEQFTGLYGVLREGGARLIEDSSCDLFNRYALQSQQIFKDPAQSLVHFDSRCDNPISYAASLFWKYLAEQYSSNVLPANEPDIGFDVYRKVLEMTAANDRPYEPAALRQTLTQTAIRGSFDEFRYFDPEHNELNSNETAWGNFLLANYLQSSGPPDTRFRYMESGDPITWPAGSPLDPIAQLAQLRPHAEGLSINQNSRVSRSVIGLPSYASRYYRITPGTTTRPRMIRISLSAFSGMNDPLIQILRFGQDGELIDISKSDRASYLKTINMSGLSSVVVIVASRTNSGDYTLTVDEVGAGPDMMITRWDSAVLTEYELNPRDHPLTRNSPDFLLDANNSNRVDNRLGIRLHNRGNARVTGISVDLQCQPYGAQLNPAIWQPVRNASNEIQTITNATLAAAGDAGDSQWYTVNWTPPQGTTASSWCVKATIHSPGDVNTDNKTAIGCFTRAR